MLSKLKKSMLALALMLGSFTAGITLQPVVAETGGFSVFLQVYDLLKLEYVEKEVNDQKLVRGAIEGMLDTLGDPYTRYMNPDEFKQMNEERAGSFSGIGIQIAVRDKQLTVIAPIEDTPAWEAGLKAGDLITEIEGKSTKNITVDDAVNQIRGEIGSTVKLTIYRPDTKKTMVVPIKRGKIETKVVKYNLKTNNIGYLRLTSFMNNDATLEVRNAIQDMKKKGMRGLILDLRSNPGGLLPNAVDIGSLFIKTGPIVRIVDRNGKEELLNADGKTVMDKNLPMVVLIDGGSASASEILAGALKDTNRATLIGTRTFGKGLVQTVHPLHDGSGVAITTNKYLTTNGTDINKKGIEPNLKVEIPKEIAEGPYSEAKDIQLQKALSFLKDKV